MRIEGVTLASGDPARSIVHARLEAIAGSDRTFRTIAPLTFATGGHAESLVIDAAACRLEGSFRAIEGDLRSLGPALVAPFDATGVIVDARTPRLFLDLALRTGMISGAGFRLELYRIDGDIPAHDPFFVQESARELERRYDGARSTLAGELDERSQPATIRKESALRVRIQAPIFRLERLEQRFLMRIRTPQGAWLPFGPADLEQLRIRSEPVEPRIGIALPPPHAPGELPRPEDALFFWSPGSTPVGDASGAIGFRNDPRFGSELARLLRRTLELRDPGAALLPARCTALLVFESNAPCDLSLDRVEVGYLLERSVPFGSDPKLRLDLPAPRHTMRSLDLALPADALVQEATLEIDARFPPDRDLPEEVPSAAPRSSGVHLREGCSAAQSLAIEEPRMISGISLGLVALTPAAELRCELREDADGTSGRLLAGGECLVTGAGDPDWPIVHFGKPVLLSDRPHWLVLGTRAGALLWLTGEALGSKLELRTPLEGGEALVRAFPDRRARFRLRSRDSVARAHPPFTLSCGELAIDTAALPETGRYRAELAPALASVLQIGDRRGEIASIPLRIGATGPGALTLSPLRIRYTLRHV